MRRPPFSPEIRRALRIDVSAALLFPVFASLTTPFIGLILRRDLGATPLQLSVMSHAGGACLLLSLAWARALGSRPPLPYFVWPSFVARGLFLLAPLASSAWSFVSLVVAANVFAAAAGPAQAAVVERLYPRATRGRALGLVRMAGAALGIGLALGAGQLFERVDYRVIFPVAAGLGVAASPRRRGDASDLRARLGSLAARRQLCDRRAGRDRPRRRVADGRDRHRGSHPRGPVRGDRRDARRRPGRPRAAPGRSPDRGIRRPGGLRRGPGPDDGRGLAGSPRACAPCRCILQIMTKAAALLLVCALVIGVSAPAGAGSPTDQLREYSEQVIKVLEDQTLKPQDRRAAVRKMAQEIFDVAETAKRALARHWASRT